MPRRPAFTLVETLVASVIVVILLGASVAANRVIQAGVVRQQEYAQMNALADEAVTSVRFLRDSAKTQGKTLATVLGLAPSSGGDVSAVGTFVSSSLGTPCLAGPCDAAQAGGPLQLAWCPSTDTLGCGTTPSPVGISGVCPASGSGPCTLGTLFGAVPARLRPADLVAVHTRASGSSTATCVLSGQWNSYGQVYDVSGISPSTCLDADLASPEWGIYLRQVKVTLPGGPALCPASPALGYHGDAGGAELSPVSPGTSCGILRGQTYTVTVTLSSYSNPALQVVKSDFLTQW